MRTVLESAEVWRLTVLYGEKDLVRHGTMLSSVVCQLFTWKKDLYKIAMHREKASTIQRPTHAYMEKDVK